MLRASTTTGGASPKTAQRQLSYGALPSRTLCPPFAKAVETESACRERRWVEGDLCMFGALSNHPW